MFSEKKLLLELFQSLLMSRDADLTRTHVRELYAWGETHGVFCSAGNALYIGPWKTLGKSLFSSILDRDMRASALLGAWAKVFLLLKEAGEDFEVDSGFSTESRTSPASSVAFDDECFEAGDEQEAPTPISGVGRGQRGFWKGWEAFFSPLPARSGAGEPRGRSARHRAPHQARGTAAPGRRAAAPPGPAPPPPARSSGGARQRRLLRRPGPRPPRPRGLLCCHAEPRSYGPPRSPRGGAAGRSPRAVRAARTAPGAQPLPAAAAAVPAVPPPSLPPVRPAEGGPPSPGAAWAQSEQPSGGGSAPPFPAPHRLLRAGPLLPPPRPGPPCTEPHVLRRLPPRRAAPPRGPTARPPPVQRGGAEHWSRRRAAAGSRGPAHRPIS
ncbi:basic proline-rich protein-like isoform X2 [Prinia subflava]